jgi:hypothetical protein
MNEDTHTIKQLSVDAIEEDPVFSDLQSLWDEQSAHLDRALAHGALASRRQQTRRRRAMKTHPSAPYRLRMLAVYAVLSVVALASAVYWGILIPSLAFNAAALVTSLVIEFIYLLLLAECLYWTVSLLVFDPARVGVLRMSRFIRRSRMRPHYGTFPAGKRKASMPAPTPESDASDLFSNHVRFRARQAAAASIAALFALTVVSCSTTGIDGNTINQDNPDRIATVENVAQIIDRI